MADVADTLAASAYEAGFRGRELVRAVAVSLVESEGNPAATNRNLNPPPGQSPELSVGPLQINLLAHGGNITEAEARDPRSAFAYAWKLFNDAGGTFSRDWYNADQALNGVGDPQLVSRAAIAQERATAAVSRLGVQGADSRASWSIPGAQGAADALQLASDALAAVTSRQWWARVGLTIGAVAMIGAGGVLYFRREIVQGVEAAARVARP